MPLYIFIEENTSKENVLRINTYSLFSKNEW
jgi:hypothetical protein